MPIATSVFPEITAKQMKSEASYIAQAIKHAIEVAERPVLEDDDAESLAHSAATEEASLDALSETAFSNRQGAGLHALLIDEGATSRKNTRCTVM